MRFLRSMGFVFAVALLGNDHVRAQSVTTVTADGVTLHGETYFGALGPEAPLILLFHQGGSDGRGEYADLVPWLNGAGFRALAWDLRSGGDRFGENRTMAAMAADTPTEYCVGHFDLQAALDYVTTNDLAEHVVVWGSSYTGTLVFRLAAENPGAVAAVLAFSPAAGGPLEGCLARDWLDQIDVPMAVFRPQSEMHLESSVEQRAFMEAAGALFHVVDDGVHGSSMLLDARTGQPMAELRGMVVEWLERALSERP